MKIWIVSREFVSKYTLKSDTMLDSVWDSEALAEERADELKAVHPNREVYIDVQKMNTPGRTICKYEDLDYKAA